MAGPTVEGLLVDGSLAAAEVAAVGQQAAAGLAAAHAEELTHNAICPQNLVIAPTGRLCIIDFGSVHDRVTDHQLPEPVFDEPGGQQYWPPERHAGRAISDRSDVYSLGLVLWEALTGSIEVGDARSPGAARRLLTRLPGGDADAPRLREILSELTAEEPDERPSAAQTAETLTDITGARPQEQLAELLLARGHDQREP